MKISGNKKNGQYDGSREIPDDPRLARAAARTKKLRKTRRVLTAVLLIVVALAAALYFVYKFSVKPPPMKPKPSVPVPSSSATHGTSPQTVSSDRKGNQYTFLILGVSGGNSDTMMVANFDDDNHKMSVVNIPRDTLVNVSWSTKKANSLYPNEGIDGTMDGVSKLLGFQPDFYVTVDLKAFEQLVNAVGGVDFNVPVNMDYDDPAQDLHIHFKAGQQHLNGQQAMEVVRFRKGYADADIGRIATQQKFMNSAAQQILQKQNKLNLEELATIFIKYVKTDLTAGNLVWFGKEFYKMNSKDITFETLPANYGDEVNGSSYVTIYVNEWLKILNAKINPFKDDIKAGDMSILTRDKNGSLYVTDGNWAGKKTWGSGGSSGSSTQASPDKPSPSPSPSPKPSLSPSASASPSPSAPASPSPSGTASPSPSGTASPSPSAKPSPSPGETVSPSPTVKPSPSPSPGPLPSPGTPPSPSSGTGGAT